MDAGIGGVNIDSVHDAAKISNEKGEVCDLCKDWVTFIEYLIDQGFIYKTIIATMNSVSVFQIKYMFNIISKVI